MIRGYKIRIYPTREQRDLIWKHIGACRFIWNYMLDLQIKRRESGESHLHRFDMIKLLTPLKQEDEYVWLKDVSNASLQRTCTTLAADYDSFFKRHTGFPKFKSRKRSKPSFPARSEKIYFSDGFAQIEKVGMVRFKTDFELPQDRKGICINARISYANGKYMLSFCMECENQAHIILTDRPMGIDLGIKDLAAVSYGDEQIVFHNINKSKRVRTLKRKLRHTQRSISRKYEASRKRTGSYEKTRNIEREENKLRKINARLTGIRSNYLHQTTHALVSMSPYRVTMEDLNVSGMMKNKHLSKAITEQCFFEFIRQMRYKCEWNGIEFVQAPRFYPSSKTCSCCGWHNGGLKLSDRTFVCQECGSVIDRDYNAAINLMKYEAQSTLASA